MNESMNIPGWIQGTAKFRAMYEKHPMKSASVSGPDVSACADMFNPIDKTWKQPAELVILSPEVWWHKQCEWLWIAC